MCIFLEVFDFGLNFFSCVKVGMMDGKCLLVRLIRGFNRGCWGLVRSFFLVGKCSFLLWLEGAC